MSEETKPEATPETTPEVKEITMTQEALDKLVQDRIARERSKYSDYDELKQKIDTMNSQQEQLKQKELEEQRQYEQLKEGWNKDKQTLEQKIAEKEQALQGEMIRNSLSNEVLRNNAYPEAIDLLRANAVFVDGQIKIQGKDANGLDTTLSVEDGVKQFLDQKPYLVKNNNVGGSGTTPSNVGSGQTQDLDLLSEWQKAKAIGDMKKANELKLKLRAKHQEIGRSYI